MENDFVIKPIVTVNKDNSILTLHTGYIINSKYHLNKSEASLLLIDLIKFIEK